MSNDTAYANAEFIEGGADFPPRWAAAATAFRAELAAAGRLREGLAYGESDRERLDLFLPEGAPKGLVVFVHGGFWRMFGRESWSHLAAGPLAHGWAVAMPSYTLAPGNRISGITRQVCGAIARAAQEVSGPILLTGHSAGGHLVARMAMADVPLSQAVRERIAGILPISPLAELEPLTATAMNADLRIDAAEAQAESPARHPRTHGAPVLVWVGAEERPAFLWQARLLSEAWQVPWHVDPGRHHFDVIDGLAEAESPLTRALIGLAEG